MQITQCLSRQENQRTKSFIPWKCPPFSEIPGAQNPCRAAKPMSLGPAFSLNNVVRPQNPRRTPTKPTIATAFSRCLKAYQTARSTHRPHKIDAQHRECKIGGGAYSAFFLGSDTIRTPPPPKKKPPDEEGLLWGWCVVRGSLCCIRGYEKSSPCFLCKRDAGSHLRSFFVA